MKRTDLPPGGASLPGFLNYNLTGFFLREGKDYAVKTLHLLRRQLCEATASFYQQPVGAELLYKITFRRNAKKR